MILAELVKFTVKSPAVHEISLSRKPQSQKSETALSAGEKRGLVQRVLKGQTFQRSSAMRAFLLYITEHAITGDTEKLREQSIGTGALGRKPDYDPADDNIVRVRAHELRERLQKHFASDGIEEPIVITLPRGSYVPAFVTREAAPSSATTESHATEPVIVKAATTASTLLQYWLPLAAVLLMAILASVILTAFLLKGDDHAGPAPSSEAIRDFWGQFFEKPNQGLGVVYADTNFALWQDMNGKTLNLGEYLSHKYLAAPNDTLGEIAARRATSPANLEVSAHLAALAAGFGNQVTLQYARSASAGFFAHGSIVLIGSHRSNPWIEVYEPNLNFELEQDPHSGAPLFRNRSPQPHEDSVYAIPYALDTHGDEEREFTSYGVLALLKGCGDHRFFVVDEGLNMQATEAVGDLITDPQRLDAFLRSVGHKFGTYVVPFEALIQMKSLPGGYGDPKVVSFRPRPAESCVRN